MLDRVTLGLRLRLLWSVSRPAHREWAKRAGVATATLSNMLADKHRPRSEVVAAVAGALGVAREALEDDAACFRELARLCGVQGVRTGPPAPATGELAELLASVPPERARDVANLLRGMLGILGGGQQSKDPPVETFPSRRMPSPGRPADEGDERRR